MHAPDPVVAGVIVLVAGPGRRLAVGTGLDVAAEGQDQPLGRGRDLGDGGIEGLGVPGRRNAKAADLADVLTRRGFDLTGRRRVVLMAEGADASTHGGSVPQACVIGRQPAAAVPASTVGASQGSCNVAVIPGPEGLAIMATGVSEEV